MKKNTLELIISGVLVFILIILAASQLKRASKRRTVRAENVKSVQESAVSSPMEAASSETIFSYCENLQWGRDPFTKVEEKRAEFINLVVEGIIWDKDNPQAMISGEVVKVGGKVGDKTVVVIKESCVILSDGEKEYTLNLQ